MERTEQAQCSASQLRCTLFAISSLVATPPDVTTLDLYPCALPFAIAIISEAWLLGVWAPDLASSVLAFASVLALCILAFASVLASSLFTRRRATRGPGAAGIGDPHIIAAAGWGWAWAGWGGGWSKCCCIYSRGRLPASRALYWSSPAWQSIVYDDRVVVYGRCWVCIRPRLHSEGATCELS